MTVTYSLVQDGYPGTGNLSADPLFVDPIEATIAPTTSGNFRLHTTSPAIDAGNNLAVPAGVTTDLVGNPRFIDHLQPDIGIGPAPVVDMGAFESTPVAILLSATSVDLTEGGARGIYAIALLHQPSSAVTLTLNSDGQVLIEPSTLIFTPENWAASRSVAVTVANSDQMDGTRIGRIRHHSASADPGYDQVNLADIIVTVYLALEAQQL